MRSRGTPSGARQEPLPQIADLLERGDTDAANRLQDLAVTGDRAVSKAARRALYLLGERGVTPAAPAPRPTPPAAAAHSPAMRSYATLSDVGDDWSLVLVRDDQYGGNPVFATVDVSMGVVSGAAQRKVPGRELEAYLKRATRSDEGLVAEVPHTAAHRLLLNAEDRMRRAARPMPPALHAVTEPLRALPEPPSLDQILVALGVPPAADDHSFSRDAAAMLREPWFRPWFVDTKRAEPWTDRLLQALRTPLVLTRAQLTAVAERVVRQATDDLIGGETALAFRERLERSALVLWCGGHAEAARAAVYHAAQIREGQPPHEVGVLYSLVHRTITAIAEMRERERSKRPEEASPIIVP